MVSQYAAPDNAGYARLVDSAGRIRWRAQGIVTKQEITDMISLAHSLSVDEQDAGSLAEIESQKFSSNETNGKKKKQNSRQKWYKSRARGKRK
eukprot:SAG22_NODE_57_length_23647_cov_11.746688_12_plen_93_part_00